MPHRRATDRAGLQLGPQLLQRGAGLGRGPTPAADAGRSGPPGRGRPAAAAGPDDTACRSISRPASSDGVSGAARWVPASAAARSSCTQLATTPSPGPPWSSSRSPSSTAAASGGWLDLVLDLRRRGRPRRRRRRRTRAARSRASRASPGRRAARSRSGRWRSCRPSRAASSGSGWPGCRRATSRLPPSGCGVGLCRRQDHAAVGVRSAGGQSVGARSLRAANATSASAPSTTSATVISRAVSRVPRTSQRPTGVDTGPSRFRAHSVTIRARANTASSMGSVSVR